MTTKRPEIDRTLVLAAICSAALIGNYLGLRSVRDALFQSWPNLRVAIPNMKIATAVFAILAAGAMSRLMGRVPAAWLLPRGFVASTLALLAIWPLAVPHPAMAGVAVYFHMAVFGVVLISGFWSMVNARYDPRAAKRLIGMISAAGTAGGLGACLLVALIRKPVVLIPVFAALHLLAAVLIGALKPKDQPQIAPPQPEAAARGEWGVALLHRKPYLRMVALLLFCASLSSFFLEYVFQNEVQSFYWGKSPELRTAFFGWYYSALPLVTLLLQALLSRLLLQKLGLAFTAAMAPLAVVLSGSGAILLPGLAMALVTRGADNTLRQSMFKSAYEIFFTPVAPKERAPAKSVIDVGADSLGDLLGGAAARLLPFILPVAVINRVGLGASVALSCAMLLLLWRLRSAYVQELEFSLLNRSVMLDPGQVRDRTSHTVMLKTQLQRESAEAPVTPAPVTPGSGDGTLAAIADLRSGEPGRVRQALSGGLPAALVPHAIPLLAKDDVARPVAEALTAVAEAHTGQLVDMLLDPAAESALRRRIARILGATGGQRAADGLLLGAVDSRFDVRVQCGRALAAITGRNGAVRLSAEAVYAVVIREVEASRSVWEGQLELARAHGAPDVTADELIRDRSARALEHVFTLLALVLPREPLRIAYQGLQSGDEHLRGTVLEYLESIFPSEVREKLWPFLEDVRRVLPPARAREEVVAEVMSLHESLRIKLDNIRGR